MALIAIGKFAKKVGVTTTTLRRRDKDGRLKPHHQTEGGPRYYSTEHLKQFIGEKEKAKKVIGYCRVSTPSQKDDLDNQVNNVTTYMYAEGYQFDIITDIGSGINYKKQGLRELVGKINHREISKIVSLYKDRLVRFGFEIIEYLCELNGVAAEIIAQTARSKAMI